MLILHYVGFIKAVLPSFFMPKFKHKEFVHMFSQEVLEKIFADKEMWKIPVGTQSTAIDAMERVIRGIMEEKPYATLSELFESNE